MIGVERTCRTPGRTVSAITTLGKIGFLLAVLSLPAGAQSREPSDKPEQIAQAPTTAGAAVKPKAETKAVEVEEITVTARKREERVQEVPIAVTALTGADLEQAKAQDISDISGLAPNVEVKGTPYGARGLNTYIRGLGYQDIEATQSPSVGVVVDGVVYGNVVNQLVDAFDVEQVEVDRGPQGLFEGKNATGGLIKVTRTRPTMDWGFKGSIGYGDYNDLLVRGLVNAPVIKDVVGLKIGLTYRERDGYFNNLYTDSTQGDRKTLTLTTAALVKPTLSGVAGDLFQDIEGLFLFDYARDRSELDPPLQFAGPLSGSVSGLPANPNNLGPHEVQSDYPEHDYLNSYRTSADIRFDTPIGRATSITGYIASGNDVWFDFDGTCGTDVQGRGCNAPQQFNYFLPVLHARRDASYWQLTQELNLDTNLSKNEFIGRIPGEIDLLTGFYYYTHHIKVNEYNGVPLDYSQPIESYVPDLIRHDAGETENSYAPFLNLSWKKEFNMPFLYSLSASAGTRYVYQKKDFNTRVRLLPYGGITVVPASGVGIISQSKNWDRWLSRVDLTYGITEYNSLYFTRADGFRSGGFSIRGTLSEQVAGQPNCANPNGCPENDFLTFLPETVASYEIGTKNEFANGAILFNFAAFWMTIDNAQNSVIVVTPNFGPGTNTYINNFQEEEIKGVEADVLLAPPFVRGLTLVGTVGYQDASINEALVDNRRLPVGAGGTAGASGVSDLSGTPFVNVPEYNYSITGTYRVPIGPTEAAVGLTWKYWDDQAIGILGTLGDYEDGYGLLGGSLSVSWENYTLSVYAQNIAGEDYRSFSQPSLFFQAYGAPRTVNGELTVHFAAGEAAPPPPPPLAQAAPPPSPPAKKKIVLRSVHFDFDKATLKPAAKPILAEAVQVLKNEGSVDIIVEGHTDSVGTEQYNLGLSRRRADTVRTYLVDHGIARSRITAEGMGESKPVASNDTADGRAQNRRVELHVT